jgi:hypothetical protein
MAGKLASDIATTRSNVSCRIVLASLPVLMIPLVISEIRGSHSVAGPDDSKPGCEGSRR